MIKQVSQIFGIGAAVAALVMGIMFSVNAIVFSQGTSAVRATLQRSIADGTINATRFLSPVPFLRLGLSNSPGGLFGHDCLIWTTLIAPGLDATALSLRTIRVEAAQRDIDSRAPANPDCQAILQLLLPEPSAQAQPANVAYDRYIMGQRTIAQFLLSYLSLEASSIAVHVLVYAVFILALAFAWQRRATAIVAMCVILLLFYGLSLYGGMLYFALSDITHALFVIAALVLRLGAARPVTCAIVGALYGAAIAQFDILTGGIPIGLAIVMLVLGSEAPDGRVLLRNAFAVVAAFCVAFISCIAIRLLMVSLIEGVNQFSVLMPSLLHRFRGDIVLETPPGRLKLYAEYLAQPLGSFAYFIHTYFSSSRLIGWGSQLFGSILVIAGLSALVAATVRMAFLIRQSDRHWPPQLIGCWLAMGVLVAWIGLFWNHTLIHPFFMARMLVIPIMCGAVAFVTLGSELSGLRPRQA